MRTYKISATMTGEDKKLYGHELEVEGPETLDEFIAADGQSGVVEVLVKHFRATEVAKLRTAIAEAIGMNKTFSTGGRMAGAIKVDLKL